MARKFKLVLTFLVFGGPLSLSAQEGPETQQIDERLLEVQVEAFWESFTPLTREWETWGGQENLVWTVAFFDAMRGDEMVVFWTPDVPLRVAESALTAKSIRRPHWKGADDASLLDLYKVPGDAQFFTSSGRRITRAELRKDQVIAIGVDPEQRERVRIVVVLENDGLRRLGEGYKRVLEQYKATQ